MKAVKKRRAASHEAFVILMRVYLQATKRPGPCIISYVGHPGSERIAFLAEMYFSLPLSSKTDGARLRVARLMAILIVASFCPGNFGILILETRIEKCVSFLLYRMRQIGSIRRVPEAYGYLIVASFCPGNFGILILEIMIFFLEILSFASLSIKSLCLFNCLEF